MLLLVVLSAAAAAATTEHLLEEVELRRDSAQEGEEEGEKETVAHIFLSVLERNFKSDSPL